MTHATALSPSPPATRTHDDGPLSLVCFPHAGGGTSRFRLWQDALPDGVRLVLPVLRGRESRFGETPLADVDAIVADALPLIERSAGGRIALAGLSFGALVAYETAARLEAAGRKVEVLCVASQRAPSTPAPVANWHRMDDVALVDKLLEIGGLTPEDADNDEFLEVFLDTIRADLQASETFLRPHDRAPLACPVHLCLGAHDPAISAADAADWDRESPLCARRTFDAGHFLIEDGRDLWFESVRERLVHSLRLAQPSV
jgi:surfactin synthase thioesterase subunit